jgi:hypothetical protein
MKNYERRKEKGKTEKGEKGKREKHLSGRSIRGLFQAARACCIAVNSK